MTQRHRRLLAVLVLAVAMLASVCVVGRIARERALHQLSAQTAQQLQLRALALQRFIDRYRVLPTVLALDPDLRHALEHPATGVDTAALNRKLEQANGLTHVSTLTLIDRRGVALAASNWRDPSSNVGLDYSFRPYFQLAMANDHGSFYGIGVSTNVAGYFIAEAMHDASGQRIGVVVVKITLDTFEQEWSDSADTILLSDTHGVVFLSNRPAWLYRPLQPLAPAATRALEHTRQYGDQPLLPAQLTTLAHFADGGRRVHVEQPLTRHDVVWQSMPLPSQGWTVHLLHDSRDATAAGYRAALITLGGWLPAILLGLFLQQRLRVARLRQRSREELERLVAHYASALRSEQDSLVQAAQQAATGNPDGLEHLPQGVSVVDAQLRLVAWNRRYANLMQFPPDLLQKGRPVEDLFRHNAQRGLLGPGDVEEAIQRRLDYLREGGPHMYERERPDGGVLEIRGNPLPDGGFVTSYADITAYKDAARELRTLTATLENRVDAATREQRLATAEARRANRNKTRYVAAAVHDLLQPLNAARLFAGALREPLHADADRALLARVEHALQALDSQLTSMLDLARLDAGGFKTQVGVFPLSPILQELARQFGIVAQARELAFDFVDTRAWVRSDAILLRRAVQNFLSNAVHYTPRGHVLLGCRRDVDHLRIEVWDTGVGIADDQREVIFEEFRRLDSGVDADERSAGLGLSIVQRIAQLLGHPVTLHSWPGRGSVFAIRVPLAAPDNSGAPTTTVTDDPESPLIGRRILCIDDDAHTRTAMTALLQRWGCQVNTAADATEAAMLAGSAPPPDLVLLDYQLGDTTGPALLPDLQQRWGAAPPVIVLTAHGDADTRVELEAAGLRFMLKPVSPSRLRALMSRLLAQHG
ncbi:PAS-domain containing protein [Rhodanobacter sp. Col0626]|uniref:PAS-domain containing protein n=1 Tax=Rhodanobacter sp. Col0626 TaxID=3415679 RepID=UPI003CF09543